MARIQRKTAVTVIIIAVVVILLIALAVILTKKHTQPATVVTSDSSKQSDTKKDTTTETDSTDATPTPQSTPPTVDPSTLTSVDIAPLNLKVSYTKGTPGFEYAVKKTADNTQYIEFTSADLIGTKCTNDEGVFAMITKNPSSADQATISQTAKVGEDTYGLSLASASCTANNDLLQQYQSGFKNGFSSLTSL